MKRAANGWLAVRAAFTDNLAYKAVALAAALLLWAWVQSEQVVQERARVALQWVLPEGFMLVEPPLPYATLTVEGVQAFTRSVRQKELSVRIDLSGATEGGVNIDLTDKAIEGLPTQVRVASIAPETLQVRLDRTLRRRLPVVVATRGEVAAGYVLDGVSVSPNRVEVTGPASLLRGITEIPTDEIDLTTLREDSEFQVGLDLHKGQLEAGKGEVFTVSVGIEPVRRERVFEGVPVVLRDDGTWLARTAAVNVTLTGALDKLEAIDPDELSVLVYVPVGTAGKEIDVGQRKGESLRYEVVHPGGEGVTVKLVEPRTIKLGRR